MNEPLEDVAGIKCEEKCATTRVFKQIANAKLWRDTKKALSSILHYCNRISHRHVDELRVVAAPTAERNFHLDTCAGYN